MDQNRYLTLRDQVSLSTLLASILLITYSAVGDPIQGITGFKEQLKNHLAILLEGSANASEIELTEKLENISVQVIEEVNGCLTKQGFSALKFEQEHVLKGQFVELASKNHRIRQLIKCRMFEFIELIVASPTATQIKIPPGLSTLQVELARITRNFLRLVTHNRGVYGEYYLDIIIKLKQEEELGKGSGEKLKNHFDDSENCEVKS